MYNKLVKIYRWFSKICNDKFGIKNSRTNIGQFKNPELALLFASLFAIGNHLCQSSQVESMLSHLQFDGRPKFRFLNRNRAIYLNFNYPCSVWSEKLTVPVNESPFNCCKDTLFMRPANGLSPGLGKQKFRQRN